MKDNATYIRERADIMGLELSDASVSAIQEKWESDPLCTLEGLLNGIRRLSDIGFASRGCVQMEDAT